MTSRKIKSLCIGFERGVSYTFISMDKQILQVMLASGLVLLVSVFASKATSRFGIPILLVFIGIGMLIGSDGPGGISFSDHFTAQILGTISLIYILFAGGLSSPPAVMKPVWREGVVLASIGVLLTATLMTCLIHFTLGWSWLTSALLSAAISSTDAPAVFGILRTQRTLIKLRLRSLVELESGSNDPMALVILLLLMKFFHEPHSVSWPEIAMSFFIQLALGGMAGWFLGKALVKIINFLNLEFEGLYPVLTMAGVVCIYSLTEYAGGNGFLSVYIAGFSMAGEKFLSKNALVVFHDGLSWLMQVAMFLMLGLLVDPSELPPVMGYSIFFAAGIIFFARPITVFLCLMPFGYSWKELLFICWGGLKGAVPIIFATYLLVGEVRHAEAMFNIIFFIVIVSMILQGFTIGPVSRWLGACEDKDHPREIPPYDGKRKTNEFIEFEIDKNSMLVGHTIFDLHLPDDVLVVLIHRDDEDFIPRGNTELQPFDRLVCLVNKTFIPEIVRMLKNADPGQRKVLH